MRLAFVLAKQVAVAENIIEYSHGTVKVLNRKKLEGSACECYALIQQFIAVMAK